MGFKHHFEQIKFDTKDKIVDIASGYQHTIFLTGYQIAYFIYFWISARFFCIIMNMFDVLILLIETGYLFGTGRANWH